jgi:hypothetical protein
MASLLLKRDGKVVRRYSDDNGLVVGRGDGSLSSKPLFGCWHRRRGTAATPRGNRGPVTGRIERFWPLPEENLAWVPKTSSAGRINTTRAGCDVRERANATRVQRWDNPPTWGDTHCPDGDQELPGLEDEVHGGPDGPGATNIASGLEDRLSSALTGLRPSSRKHRPPGQLRLGSVI